MVGCLYLWQHHTGDPRLRWREKEEENKAWEREVMMMMMKVMMMIMKGRHEKGERRKEKGVGGVIIMMSKRQGSFYFQGCMLSCLVFALFSLHSLIFPPNHKKITLPHFSLFIQTPFSALDLGNLQSLNDMKPCL